jgi:endoribonuclease Dicer
MRNARLAITSKKSNQYDMMVKPRFWSKDREDLPDFLYATVISLRPSRNLQRQCQPLLLLTREALPKLPKFPLFLEDNIPADAVCTNVNARLSLRDNDLDLITTFTLRVFQDVFHKIFEREPRIMPYWLAPFNLQCGTAAEDLDPRSVVDFGLLSFVDTHTELSWSKDEPASLRDKFIFDRWDGKYRYFSLGVDTELRPSDPPAPTMARRRHMENIMNYTLSLYKNARAKFLASCDWSQPVIKAELVQLRRNLLDKSTAEDLEQRKSSLYYICPGPLVISAVGSVSIKLLISPNC